MKVIQVNKLKNTTAQKAKLQSKKTHAVAVSNSDIALVIKFLKSARVRNKARLYEARELIIVYLSKGEMQKINKSYRQKNKATDVLSFSSADPSSIGELLICPEVLKRQALEQGHSEKHETLYMIIHGLLHLLGYDHERSKKEEQLMFSLQDRCFKNLLSRQKTKRARPKPMTA